MEGFCGIGWESDGFEGEFDGWFAGAGDLADGDDEGVFLHGIGEDAGFGRGAGLVAEVGADLGSLGAAVAFVGDADSVFFDGDVGDDDIDVRQPCKGAFEVLAFGYVDICFKVEHMYLGPTGLEGLHDGGSNAARSACDGGDFAR